MNPSTALATVLVDELVRGGVREAVLAPGSRSASLAVALHAADSDGRLRLHVRVDERSAGFLALGLAKASGAPAVVVTTSGTATANLHPAVLEASAAGVPLVVLTADRPPELRATGANQTVDQPGLYGTAVRLFHEVGAPEERAGQQAYWRGLTARALAAARGTLSRDPGPVHLNVALREPLLPTGDETWPEPLDGRAGGAPWTEVVAPRDSADEADEADEPARTLVLVGDVDPALGAQAARVGAARGWPVVSEPSGNARSGPAALRAGHLLLGEPGFLQAHTPERVLAVGRPTLHRGVTALLQRDDVRLDVVSTSQRWADQGRRASSVSTRLPTHGRGDADVDRGWLGPWLAADAAVSAAVDRLLDAEPAAEPRLARDLHAALPDAALLVAGSSLPVRDLCLARPRDGVTVLANRGAAGIDGTVSTAMGAALAWQAANPGRPAAALVGDLTLLHDAGGLLLGPKEPRPDLAVVVVDNDGGGIFGLLETGDPRYADAYERVFATPHGADLAALCGASGTPYDRVATVEEAVAGALDPRGGLHVVHLRTDRDLVRRLALRTRDAVAGALRAPDSGRSGRG
jgi:2-succinyl-5-enolpyruvyl-6-hydroxy-3-cyclohexene-1-carboxylate synthase